MITLKEFNACMRKLSVQSAGAIPTHIECPDCMGEMYQQSSDGVEFIEDQNWVRIKCPDCGLTRYRLAVG